MEASVKAGHSAEQAHAWTLTLAEEIGPRRPSSRAERVAAEWLREQLQELGVDPRLEAFDAYPTFAVPQAAIIGLGLLAGAVPRRWGRLRSAIALGAFGLGALEDDPRFRPLSRILARGRSQNLIASIEPKQEVRRTLCLVSHVDTSRSGWLFHPRVAPQLRNLLAATSTAMAVQAAEPIIGRNALGRGAVAVARAMLGVALALLAERELRGVDVPGANDNSSGAAVTAALTAELAASPLQHTRVVLLVTGAEEAGTLGADAFLRSRATSGWIFLNFDGVGARATLRYLPREGLLRNWKADEQLIAVAERIRAAHPEYGLERMVVPAGLTYDATPVLARGGRALTISAQDGTIPNYHQPSDDASNVEPEVIGRALEIGREFIAAIDRGDADPSSAPSGGPTAPRSERPVPGTD